jgi:hypothetical protein
MPKLLGAWMIDELGVECLPNQNGDVWAHPPLDIELRNGHLGLSTLSDRESFTLTPVQLVHDPCFAFERQILEVVD